MSDRTRELPRDLPKREYGDDLWALRDSNPRPPPCKRAEFEQQRLYQHIRLTEEPPEPGIDARTANSGVNWPAVATVRASARAPSAQVEIQDERAGPIAFVDLDAVTVKQMPSDVHVTCLMQLVDWFRSLPHLLDPDTVEPIFAKARLTTGQPTRH